MARNIKKLSDFGWFGKFAFWLFRKGCMYKQFDEYNLQYDVRILNKLRPVMIKVPIEVLATFVDGITYDIVQAEIATKSELLKRDFVGEPNAVDKFIKETEQLHYNHLNATGIGNVAYVALNHPDKTFRDKAYNLLNDCYGEHLERLEKNKSR